MASASRKNAPQPNRSVLLMTGNNLTLSGDLARRVLICRIDPKTDQPFAREFDLDPLEYVLKHRQEMVAAALTIVRGWLTSGAARAPGRMASFEQWDDLVRQAVAWVGRNIRPGEFADPMGAVVKAQAADPEQAVLGAFLAAFHEEFGGDWVTAVNLIDACRISPSPLKSALADLNGGREPSSPQSVGRILGYRRDRIVDGFRLEAIDDRRAGSKLWRVVIVDVDT